jgi:UDP-2,3-diacylglucosamine hydrolase
MVKKKTVKPGTPNKPAAGKKIYFFSDAHLGLGTTGEETRKESRLIGFLNHIQRDAGQIFIVGDLFDFWFEYKTVVPKGYYRLFSKLAELKDHGIKMSLVVGNHDFWIKNYFQDEFGMEVYFDPVEKQISGKRFLIHHGDGLDKKDTGYRILKKILRNRLNIFLFSLVHPDIAGFVAKWLSRTSRQYTSKRKYEQGDMSEFARKKINDGFDYVIMGHNHVPARLIIDNGIYINLGDWINENTYAVFDGKSLMLKKWIK